MSRLFMRVPLWMVLFLSLLGLAFTYFASLLGLGGPFYIGNVLFFVGILLCLFAIFVLVYGYVKGTLDRFKRLLFREEG